MKKLTAIVLATLTATVAMSGISVSAAEDEFTLAGALGNDMVLQRDAEINIWGTGKKGETVTVTFKSSTVNTTVGDDGKWSAKLPAQEKDKNENTLTAESGGKSITLTGILVGDVYLLGGQSNAEKLLSACGSEYKKAVKQELIDRDENMIRYFTQGRNDATSNPDSMTTPQENPIKGKKWKKETLTTANNFSAMGFFFAHQVAHEADVPVGVIMVASAGSPVSQLMSAEASQKSGYVKYENNIPVSGMYNALMHPFINMTVKAMLYYQGESEQGLAKSNYGIYNVYVKTYVDDLREKMQQNFPFYYVQLSSHGGDGLKSWSGIAEQRAVQFDGLKVIENSGMIVSMDVGYLPGQSDWAHPDKKQPVGERLAALVLARDYGIGDEEQVTSPMPDYAYKTDEGTVIHFTHVAGGLKKIGSYEKLAGFKALLANGNKQDVEAEIINANEVLLKTNGVSNMTGVGYALEELAFAEIDDDTKYIANLGNGSDLPAPTFKLQSILASKPSEGGSDEPTGDATPAPEATDNAPASEATATADNTGAQTENGGKTGRVIAGGVTAGVVVAACVATLLVVKKKKSKAE